MPCRHRPKARRDRFVVALLANIVPPAAQRVAAFLATALPEK
jgi:hypothetical protein